MAYEFKTLRRVEFVDTDVAGIVHFANYFRFLERETARELTAMRGRHSSEAGGAAVHRDDLVVLRLQLVDHPRPPLCDGIRS